MRHNIILVFLFSLTLLAFGSLSVNAQEAPGVLAGANAPGWITVSWEHTGQDVYSFVIERLDPPYAENSALLIGQSNNRTDSLTDKNLKADTVYKYHVCAVYAYSRTCSDWVSVRTLSPPPPSSGGGTTSPPTHPYIRTPELTATANDPFTITLHWNTDQIYELKNVQLSRDGQVVCDALKSKELADGGCLYERRDIVPRANTKYKYKVCFISLYYTDTKCSEEITASGKPVAPTAPANVTVSLDKSHGKASDLFARIRTFITAHWSNTAIRGQFITLEREDRVQLDRIRVGPAWVEIKRISAVGNPLDPTEVMVDVTPEGPELTRLGNNYRVCAVVTALGAAGTVCSPTVSPGRTGTTSRAPEPVKAQGRIRLPEGTPPRTPKPICESARVARERNSPAARGLEEKCRSITKGEQIANIDPLAVEFRGQQSGARGQDGFNFGMALSDGHTAPGPGKDQACTNLSSREEQDGCRSAVLFSVERNRNPVLAKRGAEIAQADPTVAEVRNATTDVFYRLGFDIGLAASEGHTLPGPGKDKIRDSLAPALREGFSAAVAFNLERNRRK